MLDWAGEGEVYIPGGGPTFVSRFVMLAQQICQLTQLTSAYSALLIKICQLNQQILLTKSDLSADQE
jgi:hypothetical protein